MSNSCILVVESSAETAVALYRALEEAFPKGRLLHAHSLFEARLLIDTYDVGCFIIDNELPDGGGLELVDEVKQRRPQVEVILLAGEPTPWLRQRVVFTTI